MIAGETINWFGSTFSSAVRFPINRHLIFMAHANFSILLWYISEGRGNPERRTGRKNKQLFRREVSRINVEIVVNFLCKHYHVYESINLYVLSRACGLSCRWQRASAAHGRKEVGGGFVKEKIYGNDFIPAAAERNRRRSRRKWREMRTESIGPSDAGRNLEIRNHIAISINIEWFRRCCGRPNSREIKSGGEIWRFCLALLRECQESSRHFYLFSQRTHTSISTSTTSAMSSLHLASGNSIRFVSCWLHRQRQRRRQQQS